ncbi:SDR family NAD(P)-dependent oxidoreductase [Mycolicibacterium parafortuitum]|uniref:SDR family NAD(P)-dependent oxidoreductase n=1 Tax=Mycolicibacterium parafortuitum TaxID=39692 RepID=UPI0032C421C0
MHIRAPRRHWQHVVITGGSSGLGLEIAVQLAPLGPAISLIARDPDKLARARARILAAAPDARVEVSCVDVADRQAVTDSFGHLNALLGPPDALINAAGIVREGHFGVLRDDDFRNAMEVNFFGTVNAVRAALPYLTERRGVIVNVASVAGLMGVFGFTPYCASKHAVVGFTHALRFEMRGHGVAVHLVCPGEFDTPMVRALDRTRTAQNRAHTLTIPRIPVEQVARETIRGIHRGARIIVPGWRTRGAVTVARLAPALTSTIGARRIAAARRETDIFRC